MVLLKARKTAKAVEITIFFNTYCNNFLAIMLEVLTCQIINHLFIKCLFMIYNNIYLFTMLSHLNIMYNLIHYNKKRIQRISSFVLKLNPIILKYLINKY